MEPIDDGDRDELMRDWRSAADLIAWMAALEASLKAAKLTQEEQKQSRDDA